MSVKINDATRIALGAVTLCNIGIGLILLGTLGLGPISYVIRDIIGWLLIVHAVPVAIQAIYGRLHRWGEESLLINIGLIAFAAHQILVTGNAPQPIATVGDGVLVVSAGIATTLLWAQLSGRRLGRQYRQEREARNAQGKDHP